MDNLFQRGSEWRRWDLHIHTPETLKNDAFSGTTPDEKWEQFYNDIIKYIGDGSDSTKNIAVIGITDYLSVDNYKKVILDKKLPNSVKMIIPNIEMRIQPIANDTPINIHFLFNPQIIDTIEDRFFAKLSFHYGTTDFSAAHSELVRLGKTSAQSLSDQDAYHKGIEQFVPSFDTITALFSNDTELRENVIILVSNSSNDGVSGAVNHSDYLDTSSGESQLKLFRQSIYRFVDGIFSPKPSDIDFFLGKKQGCPQKLVIEQCGSLKPCLHGSDAHKNDKLFEPDQKRYCWIKADTTFNGLKQVIYEPEERVKICELKPETKPDYLVIDYIKINDEDFPNTPIYFNDKLNCIIGGKSTGKSILLHNLAQSLDKAQVEKKDNTAQTRTKKDVKITAYWADGKGGDDAPSDERKIIYIPQTYLNKLCDEQTEKTEIDKIIQDIVLQNATAKSAFDRTVLDIKNYKSTLDKTILDLLTIHNEINEITATMKDIGDKSGIETEIAKLTKEKERLTSESSLTEEELKMYEDAISKTMILTKEIKSIDDEILAVEGILSLIEPKLLDFNFSIQTKSTIETVQGEIIAKADIEWTETKKRVLSSLNETKTAKTDDLLKAQEIETSLKSKIQDNKAVSELTEKIKLESGKLAEFIEYNEQKDQKKNIEKELIKKIVESMQFYKTKHSEFAEVVNTDSAFATDSLQFSVEVPFRGKAYKSKLDELLNNRSPVFKELIGNDEECNEDEIIKKLAKIVFKLLNEELPVKGNNTIETALRDILADWYEIKYKVSMGNDSIDVMSPGKKALVLLKLLIELADSKCPILIDQPEDDLDNRSIFDELIPFIRRKKKDRQIIIVTHNANIVLGSDAEEIIVANQKGGDAPNKLFRFEYRSGSIENDRPVTNATGTVESGILNTQGIQQHICDILEGGKTAFELRRHKYHI